MKKQIVVSLLLFCLLLTACSAALPEESSSAPTGVPDVTAPDTTASPSASIPDFQPAGAPVDAETLNRLQELFSDPNGWYSQALTGDFAAPEEIDLWLFFYRGILDGMEAISEEERAYLESVWSEHELMLDIDRLPAGQMDAVLRQYLGVCLKDTKHTGLDAFTYWAETDCYYHSHGDTNAIQVLVHSAYAQQDGTIEMYYSNGSFDSSAGAAPEHMAVLRASGDGYQIVSNQPVNQAPS